MLHFSIYQVNAQVVYGPDFAFDCNDQFTALGGTSVSAINNNGLTLQNQKIVINGTFTVDRNLSLVNCKILMGNNAKIVTSGNVRFLTLRCVFAGCTSPWNTIEINPGANFRFFTTLFRDAATAISVSPGYNGPSNGQTNTLQRNVFVNCDRGLTALGTTQNPISVGALVFNGNRFLKKNDNLNAISKTMTFGINMDFCTAVIGSTSLVNTFDHNGSGTRCGIRLRNSDVRISNCQFIGFSSSPSTVDGANGIFSDNSALIISEEANKYNKCIFTGCVKSGIKVINSKSLTIKGSEFGDILPSSSSTFGIKGLHAILVEKPLSGSSFSITDNTVLFSQLTPSTGSKGPAILVDRPDAVDNTPSASTVSGNHLFLGRSNYIGIQVKPPVMAKNTMLISGNDIHHQAICIDCKSIWANGNSASEGYIINNNVITYELGGFAGNPQGSTNTWGIALENATGSGIGHQISNNTLTAAEYYSGQNSGYESTPGSQVFCGIHLKNTPNTTVFNNTLSNTGRAFHLWFDNNNCDFRCNTMNECAFGVSSEGASSAPADLSDQVHKGNKWIGPFQVFGASNWINSGTNAADPNPDYNFIADADDPNHPEFFPPTWEASSWFIPQDGDGAACGTGFAPSDENLKKYFSNIRQQIILGTLTNTLPDVALWDHKRAVNYRMINTPGITQNISTASTWFNSQVGTSARQFAQVETDVMNANAMPIAQTNVLAGISSDMDFHFTQIQSINAAMEAGSSDSVALGAAMAVHASNLATLRAQYNTAMDNFQQQRIAQLQALLPSIQTLPSGTSHETTRKSFLLIYLQQLIMGTLTATEIESLLTIAKTCPEINGEVVEEAARLLPFELGSPFIATEHGYDCHATDRKNNESTWAMADVQISPNPTYDNIQLSSMELYSLVEKWEIVNHLGQICKYGQENTPSILIPVKDMANGYYWIRGTTSDNKVFAKSFIVQH